MDLFAPPEVTSTLIHTGPGAGSLIEAAGAWQRLAVELENSVSTYASTLSSLIESWDGSSAMAMLQSVQPYLLWLRETAQQSAQMATSAETAATAFTVRHQHGGHRRDRKRIPDHVGEQLGRDEPLPGDLVAGDHAAVAVQFAADHDQSGRNRQARGCGGHCPAFELRHSGSIGEQRCVTP
jgi:hypothetical protein